MRLMAGASLQSNCVTQYVLAQEPPQPADADLVVAAQSDPAAFASLYERYFVRIYHYLRLRANDVEEAADLTQQLFLQAFDALPTYRQTEVPFAAWLFRIAHNLASNARRRHRDTIAWDLIAPTLYLPTVAADESDPEALLLGRERLERLRQLLSALDAEKRNLLALRFVARLSVREIALAVGKSEAAVHKQFARLLKSLKEQYNAE